MLTETNVAAAIERGVPESGIRSWCHATLVEIFRTRSRDIEFDGYVAWIAAD